MVKNYEQKKRNKNQAYQKKIKGIATELHNDGITASEVVITSTSKLMRVLNRKLNLLLFLTLFMASSGDSISVLPLLIIVVFATGGSWIIENLYDRSASGEANTVLDVYHELKEIEASQTKLDT